MASRTWAALRSSSSGLYRPCSMDPASFRRLCDTDRLRASKLQHAIQRTDCDANFSRSARIRARPQCVPDHPFVSIDIGLNQRTPVVARRFLPGHSAALGNELQMRVALRRRSLGRLAQHTTRTRRHDDSCVRVTLGDFIVDIVPIERPVTDERYDRARHLVEQSADLGAIVVVIGRQPDRHDLTGLGVYTEMQFSPGPACPRAMLASRPGELHPGPLDDTPQSGYNTNRERSAKHEDGHVETAPGLRFATVDRPSGRLRFAELVRRAEGAERAAPGAGPDPAGPDRRRQGAEPAAPAAA